MRPCIEVHKHIHVDTGGRTIRSERPYFVRRNSPHQQEQHQNQHETHPAPHGPDHGRTRIIQYQYYPIITQSATTTSLHASPYSHTHTQAHAQSTSGHLTALSKQDIHNLRSISHHLHRVETDIHGLKHAHHNHEVRVRALEKEKKRSERKKEKEKEREIESLLKRERRRAKEREAQRLLKKQEERRAQVEYLYHVRREQDALDELARVRYRRQTEMLAAVERKRLNDMTERMRHDGRTSREGVYGYASW